MYLLPLPLTIRALGASAGLLLSANALLAVTLFQIDTFEDGATAGWSHGLTNPDAPRVVADGGPEGVGDFALMVSSDGLGGSGARMVMFNRDQWTGNFVSAAITSIQFDVRHNSGSSALLRLGFNGPGGQFVVATPIFLAAGTSWSTFSFGLDAALFQHLGGGTGLFADTLAGVTEMRLLSATSPAWRGDVVQMNLSYHNIQAIPEPRHAAIGIALLAAVGALAFRRRSA
jgi:hypothetical protein